MQSNIAHTNFVSFMALKYDQCQTNEVTVKQKLFFF